MSDGGNNYRDIAAESIHRVVAVFCGRCVHALDALVSEDWDMFEEYFHLQRIAWLNLEALVAKLEREYPSLQRSIEIRVWLMPCREASSRLHVAMEQKMSKLEQEGRHLGKLRRHLSAFQASHKGKEFIAENFLRAI
jgi:hypothetical protein